MVSRSNVCGNVVGAVAGTSIPARMKFKNGDIALDDAIDDIVEAEKRGEKFTSPNVDLLVKSVMGSRWD